MKQLNLTTVNNLAQDVVTLLANLEQEDILAVMLLISLVIGGVCILASFLLRLHAAATQLPRRRAFASRCLFRPACRRHCL